METYDNILEELNSLECTSLISQLKIIPFQLPEAYFNHLSNTILEGVHAANVATEASFTEKNNNFSIPEMYFQSFPEQMLSMAKSANNIIHNRTIALTENPFSIPENYFQDLEHKFVLLAQGSLDVGAEWEILTKDCLYTKTLPYSIPDRYFEYLADRVVDATYSQLYPEPDLENSILSSLKNQNPYTAPANLFSQEIKTTVDVPEKTTVTSVPFQAKKKNKFAITSVAAAVILFICFGFWKIALPEFSNNAIVSTNMDINTLKGQITEEGIERYIAVYDEEFVSTFFETDALKSINMPKESIKEISKASIDAYLEIMN